MSLAVVAERPPSPDIFASAPSWWPDWRGQTCVIVASGPSAKDAQLHLARDRARFIAINSSWKLAPWADVLYACDFKWWNVHKGCPEFKGMKMSQDRIKCAVHYREIKGVYCDHGTDDLMMKKWGQIGWGGNSGFNAINLAAQFRVKAMILVGYDMRTDLGMHWHGKHGAGLNNPIDKNVLRWCRAIDNAAPALKKLGIAVYNTSPVSMLKNYPKISFEEACTCTLSPTPNGENTQTCGTSTRTA